MATLYITIFGFGTPADAECYGLRALMLSLCREGDQALFLAYDDPQLMRKVTTAAVRFTGAGDRICFAGHSHGGAAVKWILDRWTEQYFIPGMMRYVADAAVFLDPAPELFHFGQLFPWQAADLSLFDRWHVPQAVCRRAVCLYQRNEQIIPGLVAVVGVPFIPVPVRPDLKVEKDGGVPALAPDELVTNIDVSAWGVYHCHMLSDPRVQKLITQGLARREPGQFSANTGA